ncbi:CLUMA_CG021161, isoform A [Clunio marinus]|uniref:CLUMA_CG021161, isoform A n=1 Tax=Clunio marinus TaxID=568069 RepID=A0A1J1J8A0_9DIPT|nr:CLUMA_CG021161, isoform A [Clunio marinus]
METTKIILVLMSLSAFVSCCMKPCPKILQPICGRIVGSTLPDGTQSFENLCLMENYNCENPSKQYEKIGNGECDQLDLLKHVN